MLNELYELSLSLEKAGIPTEEWHKNFQEIKKTREPKVTVSSVGNSAIRTTGKNTQTQGTPAFVVCINQEGDVTEIEQVGQARLDGVRYWQTANGVSFPCFNIRPLFKIYKGAGASTDEQDVFSKWLRGIAKSGRFSEQDDMVLRGYLLPENELWDDSQKKG